MLFIKLVIRVATLITFIALISFNFINMLHKVESKIFFLRNRPLCINRNFLFVAVVVVVVYLQGGVFIFTCYGSINCNCICLGSSWIFFFCSQEKWKWKKGNFKISFFFNFNLYCIKHIYLMENLVKCNYNRKWEEKH